MKRLRGPLYLLECFGVRVCLFLTRLITSQGHAPRHIVDNALQELRFNDDCLAIGKICQGPWQAWPEGRWLTMRVENVPGPCTLWDE